QSALRSLSCGARATAQPNSALRRAGDCRLARSRRARVSGFPALRLDYAGVARPADSVPPGRARRRRSEAGPIRAFARPDCQQAGEIRRPCVADRKNQRVRSDRTIRPGQSIRRVTPSRSDPDRLDMRQARAASGHAAAAPPRSVMNLRRRISTPTTAEYLPRDILKGMARLRTADRAYDKKYRKEHPEVYARMR